MVRIASVLVVVLLFWPAVYAADGLSPEEAIDHVGEQARICGVVASAKYAVGSNGQPTFLNLGKPHPHQDFTALIWGSSRSAFPYAPESLKGSRVCVFGVISTYGGKAQIIVSSPSDIELVSGE